LQLDLRTEKPCRFKPESAAIRLVAAGVRSTDKHWLGAIALWIRGSGMKDEDYCAKSSQNPDCNYRNDGKREYESTQ